MYELEKELLRQDPLNGTVTPLLLSATTATLNSRIRSRGLLQGKCGLREINSLAPNYPEMIVIPSLRNTKND